MIELYRPDHCPGCADIEAVLKELVVAHKVVVLEPDQIENHLGSTPALPVLKDNGKLISGERAIAIYLKELERFVANWRRFQGDACYLDEQGEIC